MSMLDPEAKSVLDMMAAAAASAPPMPPPANAHDIAMAWRARMDSFAELQGPGPNLADVSDVRIDHAGHLLRVRIYRPTLGHRLIKAQPDTD